MCMLATFLNKFPTNCVDEALGPQQNNELGKNLLLYF